MMTTRARCRHCDKPFELPTTPGRPPQFCGRKCRRADRTEYMGGIRARDRARKPPRTAPTRSELYYKAPKPETLTGAVRGVPVVTLSEVLDERWAIVELDRLSRWQHEASHIHPAVLGDGRDVAEEWLRDHAEELGE
jgi:hypothetical protein